MEDTTSSWSSRRKLIYTAVVVLFLTTISFLIFWKYWYTEPTCFDRIPNGDETGVDCGGSCSLVCAAEALAPVIRSDPRLFQVYNDVYSVVTFVENHNIDSSAAGVPYVFKLYDSNGAVIAERNGTTNIKKNKTSAIFEGNIKLTTTPARVSFELSKNIVWVKDVEKIPEIKLTHSPLLNEETSPRIEAEIENNSLGTLQNIEVVATVLDGKDNVVAASRTIVDRLQKDQQSDIFFTWPQPFSLGEMVCEKPSAVELLIDRSGSMASLGKNPPQPLTQVKEAAASFVGLLKSRDKAGLISFATGATNPPDVSLSSDFAALTKGINSLSISATGTQYTNITEALSVARADLKLEDDPEARKVIVILTDGIPNLPTNPEETALAEAKLAKSEGITLFAIGLGKDIKENFLKQIATTEGSSTLYFAAPTAKDLDSIYEKISSSICKESAARIEMFVSF